MQSLLTFPHEGTSFLRLAATQHSLGFPQAATAEGGDRNDSTAHIEEHGIMNAMFNVSRSPSEKSCSGDCDAPAFRNPLYSNREASRGGSPCT